MVVLCPFAKLVGDTQYSIVSDYLGTPTHGYDSTGNIVWERELDCYGATRKLKGEKDFCPYLYQGQYVDEETGLAYNRFRYYDCESGGYISQDPIGLEGGMKLYGYVHDSNTWTDVFGLSGYVSFINGALHQTTVSSDNPGGIIKIQATGSHAGDKVAVYDKTKNKDVWSDDYRVHHVSYDAKTNEMTMQIVNRADHEALSHIGGAKDFKYDTGFKYNSTEAIDEAARRQKLQGHH
jgi:RHS repeat-associated protein